MTKVAKRHLWAIATLIAAPFLMAEGCEDLNPAVVIQSPLHGSFTTGNSVLVTGTLLNVHPSVPVEVKVNGVQAAVANGKFSVPLPLDLTTPLQPIIAEVLIGDQQEQVRDRVTIIRGDSIPKGEVSPDGFALRMRDPGMDDVEPIIADLIGLDPAIFVPPGSVVVNDFCYLEGPIFGVCFGKVKAVVAASPAPRMTGITANIDSRQGYLDVDVTIQGLSLRANVGETSGVNINCYADIFADTMRVQGTFALEPDGKGGIDARQTANVAVQIGAFRDNTNCKGLLGGLYEVLMDLIIRDLKNDFVLPGMKSYLNKTTNGDTVIADALELVLADLDIEGAVGDAIGVVEVDAPISAIAENEDGFTVAADARFFQVADDPRAVDLARSYHVYEPFPSFGTTAPNGQPYELGLGISASGFNQLLRGMIETGLLIMSVDQVDLSAADDPFLASIGVVDPITAGLLGLVFRGGFKNLAPSELIRIDVYPTMAPFVTGAPGPNGELATLTIPHLLLSFVTESDNQVVLQLVLDGTLGFNAEFENGILNILMSEPGEGDLQFTVLDNPLGADETAILGLLPAVAKSLVPTLASALGSFPLPDFLGLQLELVDLTRNGEYMSLFFNLSAPGSAPGTPPNPGTGGGGGSGGGGYYTPPPEGCGTLQPGENLGAGQSVDSCAGGFQLLMQGDGELALFDANGTKLWNVPSRMPANIATMRTTGNFAIYDVLGSVTWSSNTSGNAGAYLHLQDDGSLRIYSADGTTVLWSATP